jgi:predicted RNA-binding Zn-ribbon protein involved in translation (DUF1610 family)
MALLFPKEELPRTPRKVLMHVIDAGNGCGMMERGQHIVEFQCPTCGHNDGWHTVNSVSEGRRGIPCPKCNDQS